METGATTPPPINSSANAGRAWNIAPGLAALRSYRARWLINDLLAGLALTTILVPAGMGYATATGLPAIYGLYATVAPLIAYAIFGPSRLLIIGPDSSLVALVAVTIIPLSGGDAARVVSLAAVLAIISGAICFVAGLARLGFVTELLSKPIRHGYMTGIALAVIVRQLSPLVGFEGGDGDTIQRLLEFLRGFVEGQANFIAACIGFGCLILILSFRRWFPKFPGVLLAVVGATVVAGYFKLAETTDLPVVGELPQGLPRFQIPQVLQSDFGALLSGAFAVALVSFADMSVLSRTYAQKYGDNVVPDKELIALGVANIASGLFQGFSVSSSSSRTPVAEAAGAKTQVAGVVGAICIAVLLVFAPRLLRDIPLAALAAVVIAACLNLIELKGIIHLYRLRPSELAPAAVCFLGVVVVGVIEGIFISVGLALLAVIWRAWRPYDAVLGRIDGVKGYHDISRHPEAKQIPGLILFRWDAPLFFANAEFFESHVLDAINTAATPTKRIVVAAEPVTDIDTTAVDMLTELHRRLNQREIELCFAELKGPAKDWLKRYGLFQKIGEENFYPTIGQAVDQYIAAHHVEWVDWEDQR